MPTQSSVSALGYLPLGDNPVGRTLVTHGFDVSYLEHDTCGSDIRTVRLQRPESYRFKAGQWFTLRLDTAQGRVAKTFSHCSAPADPYLELTTRISGSAFKQALAALEPGAKVHIEGPGGRLSLAEDLPTVAFLVGGVGITPVRSILRDAAQRGRRFQDALLLYGNRDESCAPFLAEFEAMTDIGVRVVVCYERPSSGWRGESGFITAEMVRRHLALDNGRPFVVTGPPVMVDAMQSVLDDLAVNDSRRVIERFSDGK
jgi:glycine betaine catabolism B